MPCRAEASSGPLPPNLSPRCCTGNEAAIPAADDLEFGGGTPTAAGFTTAATHLESLDDGQPRSIVLITDGAANCASPENFVTEYDGSLPGLVSAALETAGTLTYVVGVDITTDGGAVQVNPQTALHELANAGGVPSDDGEFGFYDGGTPVELEAALYEITTHIACQLDLEIDLDSLAGMVIEAGGTEYTQLDNCGQGDGWVQVDPQANPTKIELCNAACEDAADAGSAEALFPCPMD